MQNQAAALDAQNSGQTKRKAAGETAASRRLIRQIGFMKRA
jgi:hypothetical protein